MIGQWHLLQRYVWPSHDRGVSSVQPVNWFLTTEEGVREPRSASEASSFSEGSPSCLGDPDGLTTPSISDGCGRIGRGTRGSPHS